MTVIYIICSFLQSLTPCRVGGPQSHSQLDLLLNGTTPTIQETKKPSPLRSLFKHATRNHSNQTDIESIPYGTQDEVWGPALALHGQIGCVCLLHDLISQAQIEALYRGGPNNLTMLDIPDAADLMGKLILRYNAKVGNPEVMPYKLRPFGTNNLTMLDIPDAADLMGKLILRYNAKVGNSEAVQVTSFDLPHLKRGFILGRSE